jgi:hypothetical protein
MIGKENTAVALPGRMTGQSRPPPELVTGMLVNADDKISKVNIKRG